jgi:DNA polymerase-1
LARDKGYVETLFGRKRILNDINSRNPIVRGNAERNAINAPLQGSAADIIKIAMINVYKRMQENNMKSKMIIQVHDELNFDVYKPELEELKKIVQEEMVNAVELKVPLIVDMGEGNNWLEAH